MQVQTTSKTFEVNQICQCGISQTSYYIVTRISKSNVWFKAIEGTNRLEVPYNSKSAEKMSSYEMNEMIRWT